MSGEVGIAKLCSLKPIMRIRPRIKRAGRVVLNAFHIRMKVIKKVMLCSFASKTAAPLDYVDSASCRNF